MKFEEAIQAHAAWKVKLVVYVRKPDGVLKSSVVGASNLCALGKWLEGTGKKYASLPEYQRLVAEHARFHRVAGSIIERADSGAKLDEESVLGAESEYGTASRTVVKAILDLKGKAQA